MTFAALQHEYQELCDEIFKEGGRDYSKLNNVDYALAMTSNGYASEKYKFALNALNRR